MSRPDDGHHTFLPFGNPFKIKFFRGPHMSPNLQTLLNDFEQMLATSLTNLKPNDSSEIFSLIWMRRGIESLSLIHTNIKNLITDLEFPVSDWDKKWMDVYLDGSIKLLDICIALRSELSRLDQGQLFVHCLVQVLSHSSELFEQMKLMVASLHDWKTQMSSESVNLENCHDILKNLADAPYSKKAAKNSDKSNVLMRALYGVKVHTVIVFSVVTAVLSGCLKPLTELRVSDKFRWSKTFNELQDVLLSEIMAHTSSEKVIMLRELEAVELCVNRLHDLSGCVCDKEEKGSLEINVDRLKGVASMGNCLENEGQKGEKLKELVSDLAERSEKLSQGLDAVAGQIDGFFQIVLTGRDALLFNLRASNGFTESNEDESALRRFN